MNAQLPCYNLEHSYNTGTLWDQYIRTHETVWRDCAEPICPNRNVTGRYSFQDRDIRRTTSVEQIEQRVRTLRRTTSQTSGSERPPSRAIERLHQAIQRTESLVRTESPELTPSDTEGPSAASEPRTPAPRTVPEAPRTSSATRGPRYTTASETPIRNTEGNITLGPEEHYTTAVMTEQPNTADAVPDINLRDDRTGENTSRSESPDPH
jgi:hypothetical protein